MPSSSSSRLQSPPLLLLLLLLPGGAAESCGLRGGKQDFLLDVADAVKEGASLLAAARVSSAVDCERACCADARCNLAQVDLRAGDNLTCTLFNCVRRSRFVCRFVRETGFQVYIRGAVFRKYLEGPQGPGEKAPPIANTGGDVIAQPGAAVTLNGTESLALYDAQLTDYRWSLVGDEEGVHMESTALSDQVRVVLHHPGRFVFKLTVTDSNGQSHAANASVLVLSPEMSYLYCCVPPSVGPCRAAFPRWSYNVTSGVCEQFVYGGCNGNKNNFLSETECVSACRGVTGLSERRVMPPFAEECDLPCRPDQLVCGNGCCLDRSQECDGVTQCSDSSDENHCSRLNKTLSHLLDIDINQRKATCTEPPHTGPCRASHSRWFYNPLLQKCFVFTFGGCEANSNNFLEEAECKRSCSGVAENDVFSRGLFERFERDEEEKESGSIALAVVLSVAILALLTILTYCFLRSRRKYSHRPVATSPTQLATNPTHMALSEQDTSVYNSTTKPV
ncbi:unnamed protein product [Ophioblennius macclurei]